ncbi:hypothetical protein A2U01_0114214, partial [Trifolium medium]|nr:hypothetical protein [Trifolium medium]
MSSLLRTTHYPLSFRRARLVSWISSAPKARELS